MYQMYYIIHFNFLFTLVLICAASSVFYLNSPFFAPFTPLYSSVALIHFSPFLSSLIMVEDNRFLLSVLLISQNCFNYNLLHLFLRYFFASGFHSATILKMN